MHRYGTYYFFFTEGIAAITFVYFFLPETKGRALEELDAIFALPWYRIGRAGRQYVDDNGLGLVDVPEKDGESGHEISKGNAMEKSDFGGKDYRIEKV